MEIRRFYVPAQNIENGAAKIEGEEFYHMTKVLRYKCGYKACVCCGDGFDYLCEIEELEKSCARLKILSKIENRAEPKTRLTLCQAILKNDKLDIIVQKSVELGADEIQLFVSQNVSASAASISLPRLERIAKEACKQCGRAKGVLVKGIYSFDEIIKNNASAFMIFPYEKEKENNFSKMEIEGENVALIIGSEGGFTEEERNIALRAGARSVSLGKRILRADTAAIVSTAAVMMKKGELDV